MKKKLSFYKKQQLKLIRTIITYLLSVVLQVYCFFLGRRKIEEYNEGVRQQIEEPNLWEKLLGKKTEPQQLEFASSSEWFSMERLDTFDIKYYDLIELKLFIALFSITALCYLAFTTDVVKKDYKYLRPISLMFSLLSGYIVLYEIIAIGVELLNWH